MSTVQDLNPLNITTYEPGFCNIGPAEIARRRRAGVAVSLSGLRYWGSSSWSARRHCSGSC